MTSHCVRGAFLSGLVLRPAIEYAGILSALPTTNPEFPSSATRRAGAVMSDADSGSSAASTDDAGAISSQDAAGQQAEVIEVETEEGEASNTAEAVWVVESAKIFDVRTEAE